MSVLSPAAKLQFTDITGAPLVGGLLYTYAAGTTTPLATYTNNSGTSANSNPIVLDARGEANVWLGAYTYKFKLTDSNNNEIWTVDNISAPTTALSPVFVGNVTIESNSSNAALTVTQSGYGPVLNFIKGTDSTFYIDANGNIGVNTATPSEQMDIWGGTLRLSSDAGVIYTDLSADVTDSFLSVADNRNLVLQTNNIARATINGSSATYTVPIVLPGLPTSALQAATKSYVDQVMPAGMIMPYASLSTPTGWLWCNGAEISRSTYATLFNAISTTWGAGNGTTTFNIPDLRGMFLRGTGTNGTIGGAIGPAVGASQTDTYLNHAHTINDPTHVHNVGVIVGVNGGGAGAIPYPQTGAGTVVTSSAQPTGISVNTSTTGGTETRPKNYGVLYIIKI